MDAHASFTLSSITDGDTGVADGRTHVLSLNYQNDVMMQEWQHQLDTCRLGAYAAYFSQTPARYCKLLDIVYGGIQVLLVLGSRLPPLVLRLQCIACDAKQSVPTQTISRAKRATSKVDYATPKFGRSGKIHSKGQPQEPWKEQPHTSP